MAGPNITLAVDNAPAHWNDAEIIGEATQAYCDSLERDFTFLTGNLYGSGDRRNTQDGEWQAVTMPLEDWIAGGPREGASPAWGFSRHPVGKRKEGSAIVLGSSVGGARKAKAMDTMCAVGLDIDSGITYADMVEKLEGLGRFALIYTTFSHGKCGLELKRDEVLRKLDLSRDPTDEEVRTYLRRFDKNRYEESFIEAATIREQKHQTSEGVKIVLDTPELDKMRVIFPLAEPVRLIDLANTQSESLRLWEDKVTGLARNVLGVHFDTSATDPSRLFFLPRHAKGGMWDCAIVQGDPLSFEDIPEMEKAAYTRERVPGGSSARHFTDSGVFLNSWYAEHADRFQIADLLETLCPDKVRGPASSVTGVVIECPFEGGHSSEGGSGTIAINALDALGERGTIKCSHDSCQGRKNAEYLAEMLARGWFTEEELFDTDAGFILESGEEVAADPFPRGPANDVVTANPLDPIYDERLVDPQGFLRAPEDAAPFYAEYGIKVEKDDPDRAYRKMAGILCDQIKDSMRARFSYVVTPDGAKAAIRPAKGEPPVFYSEGALERLFRNREVTYGDNQKLKPATLFFFDRDRATFDGTCFEPAASVAPDHKFNIWTGFAVEPKKGDWSKLRDHVRDVICGGDEDLCQWFMAWCASPYARPGVKVPSSVAVKGEQGTGKSKFFDWLRTAMGCAAMKVSQGKHLTGSFNAHLDGKLLLVCEEAFWAGDKAAAGVIKDLITAEELTVEAKFENAVTRPNRLAVAFISNNEWIIPTGGKDARRFLVLEASAARKEDAAYFNAIDAQMRNGGLEAMVYDLVNWDPKPIGGWDALRTPPKTDSLREQARMGLSGPLATLFSILEEGELAGRTADGDVFYYSLSDEEPTRVARSHLTAALGAKSGRGNETAEAYSAIRKFLGDGAVHDNKDVVLYWGEVSDGSRVDKTTGNRVRYVDFPPLNDLKETMAEYRSEEALAS